MMERGEPSLVPEWYKPANGASAAAANHSHNTGLSPQSDHHRSATTSRVSASTREVLRSSAFGDRVGPSSNGSKDLHPYSSFGRSRRDRERDMESRGRDRVRDRKQIDDRFYGRSELYNANSKDKDRSRRSQSMEPGRQIESQVKKLGNGVRNGVVSGLGGIGGISRASFDRDFPSLGPGLPDRVSSPGIATVVPCTPMSSLPVIRADGWTSALVDVPAPQTPTATTGLKMAEALAQAPRVHTPPQLSKAEELARRQSKMLIPVTPSMPKTLAERKSGPHCERCGYSISSKTANKLKHESEQLLCSHCDKLLISKQYCGICKKLWHPTDGGSWVRCYGCRVWIHAECDKACSNLKDLEHADYFCPDCNREKKHSQVRDNNKSWLDSQSDKLTVCCAGVEGTYLLDEHAVLCHCGSCKAQMQTLTDWERHTGCRSKKWRSSVKVKSTMEPLGKWVCTQR